MSRIQDLDFTEAPLRGTFAAVAEELGEGHTAKSVRAAFYRKHPNMKVFEAVTHESKRRLETQKLANQIVAEFSHAECVQ